MYGHLNGLFHSIPPSLNLCLYLEDVKLKENQVEAIRIDSDTNKLDLIALIYEELGWEELRSRRLLFYYTATGVSAVGRA